MRSERHVTGLETLRAIAALAVVVHHGASLSSSNPRLPWMRLAAVGDSGVAVFFALSGFLIYLPFARHAIAGSRAVRWRSFWWRRALRILPAYWLALTAFWVLGSFQLGDRWWRFYLLVQIYQPSDAFNGLTVAWSLATEGSFYLAVPFLAELVRWAGLRRARIDRVRLHLIACGLLFAGAFVARWAIARVGPRFRGVSFQWFPMNADLFAVGMAIAVLRASYDSGRPHAPLIQWLARYGWVCWTAAGGLYVTYALVIGPTTFEVGYRGWYWQRRSLVLGSIAALLIMPIVFSGGDHGRLRRAWRWRPAVWIGTVSYGLYLWHQEWMEWATGRARLRLLPSPHLAGRSAALVTAIGLALGLVSAAASWYGLEQPLTRWRSLVR